MVARKKICWNRGGRSRNVVDADADAGVAVAPDFKLKDSYLYNDPPFTTTSKPYHDYDNLG